MGYLFLSGGGDKEQTEIMEIQYGNTIPNADEYYLLYETTGWNSNNTYSKEKLFKAINNRMNLLFNECTSHDIKWVQLSCAKGKQNFYKKFGFQERSIHAPGMQIFL